MSLHISLVSESCGTPFILCGALDGDFIDAKYIVGHKWKARLAVFLFGCRECGVELRRIMKTARPIDG